MYLTQKEQNFAILFFCEYLLLSKKGVISTDGMLDKAIKDAIGFSPLQLNFSSSYNLTGISCIELPFFEQSLMDMKIISPNAVDYKSYHFNISKRCAKSLLERIGPSSNVRLFARKVLKNLRE